MAEQKSFGARIDAGYQSIKNLHLLTTAHGKMDQLGLKPAERKTGWHEPKPASDVANAKYSDQFFKGMHYATAPLALIDGLVGSGNRPASLTGAEAKRRIPEHSKVHYAEGALEPALNGLARSTGQLGGAVGHAVGSVIGGIGGIAAPLLNDTTAKSMVAKCANYSASVGGQIGAAIGAVGRDVVLVVARLATAAIKGAYTLLAGAVIGLALSPYWLYALATKMHAERTKDPIQKEMDGLTGKIDLAERDLEAQEATVTKAKQAQEAAKKEKDYDDSSEAAAKLAEAVEAAEKNVGKSKSDLDELKKNLGQKKAKVEKTKAEKVAAEKKAEADKAEAEAAAAKAKAEAAKAEADKNPEAELTPEAKEQFEKQFEKEYLRPPAEGVKGVDTADDSSEGGEDKEAA